MKVCDLISLMPDTYLDIRIEVVNEAGQLTDEKYIIEKHSMDYTHIPANIWNTPIMMIVPYCDYISLCVGTGNLAITHTYSHS